MVHHRHGETANLMDYLAIESIITVAWHSLSSSMAYHGFNIGPHRHGINVELTHNRCSS